MQTVLNLTLPGRPVPWSRAGQMGKRHFTPKRARDEMDRWRFYAGRAWDGKPLIEGPVVLNASFVFEIPKSWPKWKKKAAAQGKIHMTARPDIDNLGKLVKDALNSIVYEDDRLIVENHCIKQYGPEAKTTIQLFTIGENSDRPTA